MNNKIESELEKYPIPKENAEILVRKYMVDGDNNSYETEEKIKIKVPKLTEEQKNQYKKEFSEEKK